MCKSWRKEAQPLMWEELHVTREPWAIRLIHSPAFGRFTTKELFLDGEDVGSVLVQMIIGGAVNL